MSKNTQQNFDKYGTKICNNNNVKNVLPTVIKNI